MARKEKTAAEVFAANRERVRKALAGLDEAIRSLEAGAAKKPRDWGYAGSLGRIAEVIEDLKGGFEIPDAAATRAFKRIVDACEGDAAMANALIVAHAGEHPTVEELVAVAEHAEAVQAEIAEEKAGWSPNA